MSRLAPQHDLVPDTRCCVADGVTTQRDILAYRVGYLCKKHRALWEAADAAETAREQRRAAR